MVLVYGQVILRAVCINSRYVIIDALRCSLGIAKCSVTAILFDVGLPSFDTLMHNYRYSYHEQWLTRCCYCIPQKYWL